MVYQKLLVRLQNSQSLASFFFKRTLHHLTLNPKVIYDQYNSRFVVVTLERTTSTTNTHTQYVRVSKTSDPNGGWWFTSINYSVTITFFMYSAIYPGLAVTEGGTYITNNMFSFSGNSF